MHQGTLVVVGCMATRVHNEAKRTLYTGLLGGWVSTPPFGKFCIRPAVALNTNAAPVEFK